MVVTRRYEKGEITRILQDIEGGATIADVCRKYGVSRATIHRWRSAHAAVPQPHHERIRELEAEITRLRELKNETARLAELKAENARLKKIVGRQVLEIDVLEEQLGKGEDC